MNIRRLIYVTAVTLLAAFLISAVVSCNEATDAIDTKKEATETVATDDQAADETLVELLFVQYAESVTLSEGVLTLKGVTPDTLYFSDRPHRIVGRETTEKFVQSWDAGEESFAKTPPNAVLAVMQKPVPLDLVVVLKDPVLEGDTLTYQVEVLDGPDSGEGEASALFIDAFNVPLLDGVRRSAHRTVRRIDHRVDNYTGDYGDNYNDDYDDPDDRDAYREGYEDGRIDDDYVDDFDDADEQVAYRKGYEDGQRDDDYGDSYNDDIDDPDERDAYRKGYEDGRYDNDYEDDYDDPDDRDAYRDGHEDGRRDGDYSDD
jgi:hypothetical protein